MGSKKDVKMKSVKKCNVLQKAWKQLQFCIEICEIPVKTYKEVYVQLFHFSKRAAVKKKANAELQIFVWSLKILSMYASSSVAVVLCQ